ncbi:uncharacterized protein PgNI_04778 [Pyricularia grisea]|uniref:Uncharacterized protein n=1 Tax=Pyricularia grisea TaxID=148305 RepID=A0A6P8BCL4_PYRGI|nr:uncharacterized protein PgNI_04778 [Pyricularia grisea]TLD13555.1 hypothetical protein PgNI_04778 [Pyricularia grisea]
MHFLNRHSKVLHRVSTRARYGSSRQDPYFRVGPRLDRCLGREKEKHSTKFTMMLDSMDGGKPPLPYLL